MFDMVMLLLFQLFRYLHLSSYNRLLRLHLAFLIFYSSAFKSRFLLHRKRNFNKRIKRFFTLLQMHEIPFKPNISSYRVFKNKNFFLKFYKKLVLNAKWIFRNKTKWHANACRFAAQKNREKRKRKKTTNSEWMVLELFASALFKSFNIHRRDSS